MIQANELRINNWVFSEEMIPFKITEGSDIDDFKRYEPIELTEEILLKCGFTKYQWQNAFFIYTTYGDLFIHIYKGRVITSFKTILRDSIGQKMSGLKFIGKKNCIESILFLHQLQNLYFALTGQELEINL